MEGEDSLSISNERPVENENPHPPRSVGDDEGDKRDVGNESTKSSEENDEASSKERKKVIKKAFDEFKEGEWGCRDIGIIPDFDDCRKYYICYEMKHKIRKTRLKCPKHTRFHRKEQKCVDKKKADCARKKHILDYLEKMKDLVD